MNRGNLKVAFNQGTQKHRTKLPDLTNMLQYHHLQKFKTNFQNPTTQWKKQSWKYLLFKNIYFQQITILYHTLPPLWYEMVTVSYLVCPQLFLMYLQIIEIPTNSQVVLNFCKWWYKKCRAILSNNRSIDELNDNNVHVGLSSVRI